MEVLSKKIKIPQKGDDVLSRGFPIRQWDEETLDEVTVFYKDEDSQLLENKWGAIVISLETILKRLGYASGSLGQRKMILFTEGKRSLKSVYLVFIENEEKSQKLLNLSFKKAKKFFPYNFFVIKLDFKYQLFNFSSFYLVEQLVGKLVDKKINWGTKDYKAILPVKFDNKNSNGIIDLGDILYKMFPSNANAYEFATKSISILVRYVFSNFATREYYSLKEKENMSKEEKHFFDNINIKEILLKNNNKIILMEDGSNYLMSLEQ